MIRYLKQDKEHPMFRTRNLPQNQRQVYNPHTAKALRDAVDDASLEVIKALIRNHGDNASIMNTTYKTTSLDNMIPGYSSQVDTLLMRALRKNRLDIVIELLKAPALDLTAVAGWEYRSDTGMGYFNKKAQVSYDDNHHYITQPTALMFAQEHCQAAVNAIQNEIDNRVAAPPVIDDMTTDDFCLKP